jgi:GNAT superfamily N-acetyltransferase
LRILTATSSASAAVQGQADDRARVSRGEDVKGGIVAREATLADAAAIAGLVSQLGYPTGPADMLDRLASILAKADYATFVADLSRGVVGVVGVRLGDYYERTGVYAQVVLLSVEAAAQRCGVGRALLTAAENWARDRGAGAVLVQSGHQRFDAHAFYEHVGYTSTGLRFVKQLNALPDDESQRTKPAQVVEPRGRTRRD